MIRETTGCSVVAMEMDGAMTINPDPQAPIRDGAELVLLGTYEGEQKLLEWSQA
ncbi:MAG: hypothetical protein U5R49_04990 [Deltaproteobacteria bacterium]|nr:hypothetical protein [Deltaproteobacteria bacterium]